MEGSSVLRATYVDRRRRDKLPVPVLFFGVLFLLSPFANLLSALLYLDLPAAAVPELLQHLGAARSGLILGAAAAGAGILSLHPAGLLCFGLYAPTLLAFNLWSVSQHPSAYNLQAFFGSVLASSAVLYFGRRDVFAPYLRKRLGFRRAPRRPVCTQAIVQDHAYTIADISDSGCFLEWKDCPLRINQSVVLKLPARPRTVRVEAGVVRITTQGVGLAFRSENDGLRQAVEQLSKPKART